MYHFIRHIQHISADMSVYCVYYLLYYEQYIYHNIRGFMKNAQFGSFGEMVAGRRNRTAPWCVVVSEAELSEAEEPNQAKPRCHRPKRLTSQDKYICANGCFA